MLGLGTFSMLIALGIIAFAIYFIFKQIQFFVLSVGLYKKMVSQQDATIKLLLDIRDNTKNYTSKQKVEEYALIKGQFGDAYCVACNKTSPMNGMYHHRATDTYYHKDCLPQMQQSSATAQPTAESTAQSTVQPAAQPTVQPAAEPTALPTTLFCAQCGERLEPGITFCPNCGTKAGLIPAVS